MMVGVMQPLDTSQNLPGANTARIWNPLATDGKLLPRSCYAAWSGSEVIRPLEPHRIVDPELCDMHTSFRECILLEGYPCVGARSAINRNRYRFGLYPSLASSVSAATLCHDLYEFNHEFPTIGAAFLTFIAGFEGPQIESELDFERLLWKQLQAMHDIDRQYYDWDIHVNSDPAQPRFSFSIGGRGFFIVGMHPLASRIARTMPRPMLIFNAHEQFESLRTRGKFEIMKQMIRARDMALQGSINPILQNYGVESEARQYSGRAVPDKWVCPFHPRSRRAGK